MCIDPASAATITRVLAYSARTFPLDCNVYLGWFSLWDSGKGRRIVSVGPSHGPD